jgi:hypothetical protein
VEQEVEEGGRRRSEKSQVIQCMGDSLFPTGWKDGKVLRAETG